MNGLIDLIDSRVKKCDNGLKTIPCIVLELKDNEYVKVATLTDQSIFTVLNESGSSLEIGETVQLAYTGLLSNSSGYIIASKNKSSGAAYSNVELDIYTGALFSTNRIIAGKGIKATGTIDCNLYIDCVISSDSDGVIEFQIEVNGVSNSFCPKQSINADQYENISFTIPVVLSGEQNTIFVYAKGTGLLLSAKVFVGGHGLEGYDLYDDTGDNDYIYNIINNKSNVIYYIGNSTRPRMPLTLSDTPIDKLYSTAFNYINVQSVYIPEGITEID